MGCQGPFRCELGWGVLERFDIAWRRFAVWRPFYTVVLEVGVIIGLVYLLKRFMLG